jgi:hypothetical protein
MDENNRPERPKIDRTNQDTIGRELRAMYQELLGQPLPENLIAPLRALEALARPSGLAGHSFAKQKTAEPL